MKRITCLILALAMMLCACLALAQDWTCERCGSENAGNFCGECGSARPDESWKCASCGQTNDSNFCSNCGAKMGSGAGGSELIAEPLTGSDAKPRRYDLMGLEYYTSRLDTNWLMCIDGVATRAFEGTPNMLSIVKAYTRLLRSEYYFEVVGEPYEVTYDSGNTFFEYNMRFTGGIPLNDTDVIGQFTETRCDLSVSGAIMDGELTGRVKFNTALLSGDDGYRESGDHETVRYVGESFTAGLLREANGTFATDDGALRAGLGEAMVIADGDVTTFSVETESDYDYDKEIVRLVDEDGEAYAELRYPMVGDLRTGMILTRQDLLVEDSTYIDKGGISSYLPSNRWPMAFIMRHAGSYVMPVCAMSGEMTEIEMRVMYGEKDALVIYACAEFESRPKHVEMLIAVPRPDDYVPATIAEGECTICYGDGVCVSCYGKGKEYLTMSDGERMEVNCSQCRPSGSGHCGYCRGRGYR